MTIKGRALIFALSMFVGFSLVYGLRYGDWLPVAIVVTIFTMFALFYWGFLCIVVGVRMVRQAWKARHEA